MATVKLAGRNLRIDFTGMADMLSYIRDTPVIPHTKGEASDRPENNNWTLTPSLAAAIELAQNGWKEGAARVNKLADHFLNVIPQKSLRRETAYSIVGPGTVNIGRYIAGHPKPWMVRKEWPVVADQHRGVIRIVFNYIASGGMHTEAMYLKGAAVVALIDILEKNHYRVELDAVCHDRDAGYEMFFTTRIKNANDHIEVENLTFILAHPSMLRRLGFRIMETAPMSFRNAMGLHNHGGYGQVTDPTDADERGDIYIAGSMYGTHDEKSAINWVRTQLQEQGIEFAMEDDNK